MEHTIKLTRRQIVNRLRKEAKRRHYASLEAMLDVLKAGLLDDPVPVICWLHLLLESDKLVRMVSGDMT